MEQTCMFCGGHLEEKFVTRLQEYQGHWYIVENVPALVCEQCGEQFFSPAAHDLVVKLITGNAEPARLETIKVYDAKIAS
ncbi:MAG: YgiT-type zinc finger protein [Anaerolineae bacterium]